MYELNKDFREVKRLRRDPRVIAVPQHLESFDNEKKVSMANNR